MSRTDYIDDDRGTKDDKHDNWVAEREAREKMAAAKTVTVTAFYAYHPADRKAKAREALRHVIESYFRRNEGDGMVDVALEGLWNIMAGHNG